VRDVGKAICDYLLAQASLTALTGTRIHAETDTPPPGYKPSDGGCVCFKTRGGDMRTQEDALILPSVQFKCYAASDVAANAVYRALFDALQGARAGTVRWAQIEALGATLSEPETGWPFVLTYYKIHVAND